MSLFSRNLRRFSTNSNLNLNKLKKTSSNGFAGLVKGLGISVAILGSVATAVYLQKEGVPDSSSIEEDKNYTPKSLLNMIAENYDKVKEYR